MSCSAVQLFLCLHVVFLFISFSREHLSCAHFTLGETISTKKKCAPGAFPFRFYSFSQCSLSIGTKADRSVLSTVREGEREREAWKAGLKDTLRIFFSPSLFFPLLLLSYIFPLSVFLGFFLAGSGLRLEECEWCWRHCLLYLAGAWREGWQAGRDQRSAGTATLQAWDSASQRGLRESQEGWGWVGGLGEGVSGAW